MKWQVQYHPGVADDLEAPGPDQAARIMHVIDARIYRGDPDKAGKPLGGELSGCRRIRTGPLRVVYRVDIRTGEIVVLAVGPRRQDEVYQKAERRKRP